MANVPNLAELVRTLAEIASQTTDPHTAQRLIALVHQLMTDAGVPEGSEPRAHALERRLDSLAKLRH